MSGHIVERGPNRWAIVLETRDASGKRKQRWHSFKGTKREAKARLAELITEREQGAYVEPSRMTVARYFEEWLRDWAPAKCQPKALERYAQLAKHVIVAIGDKPMQQVRGGDLNRLYRDLQDPGRKPKPLSPRTVKHVDILVRTVFRHAVRQTDIKVDPCKQIDAPSAPHEEAAVLRPEEIPILLNGVRDTILSPIAIVALGTGMRRGELCALRWQDVDLDAGTLKVERSLEETRKGGLRFKPPKSARGRRTISLSPSVVETLRAHWKAQQEQRLALGQGRAPADHLVFATYEGKPRSPDGLSKRFSKVMTAGGLPHVSLHTLRHTHASLLIQQGVDILTISRRLGHSSAAITLNVYGHIITSKDRAADILEGVLGGIR
jgi:integrase